jgi:hypothetical protein
MYNTINPRCTAKITIISLALVAVSGREAVPLRPFTANIQADVYAMLRPQPAYTVDEISGPIASAFRPDMYSQVAASIPHGWSTDRYRYILQVRAETAMGLTQILHITGYSDYFDPTLSLQTVDPNLCFRIDSVSSQTIAEGTMHSAPVAIPAAGTQLTMMHSEGDAQRYLQRPVDVFGMTGPAQIASVTGDAFSMAANTIHPLGMQAVVDKRLHAVPSRYAYALMDAAVKNVALPDGLIAQDEAAYRQQAIITQLSPPSPTNNPLVAALASISRDLTGANIDRWTVGQLMQLDSSFGPHRGMKVLDERGIVPDYGTMSDYSPVAQIGAMYAQSVPALMSTVGLSGLHFQQYYDGTTMIVDWLSPGQDSDYSRHLLQLTTALKNELWASASYGGQFPFMVDCTCLVYSNTMITITDHRGNVHNYNYPAFAASTYVPSITADPRAYMETATQVASLMDVVGDINQPVNLIRSY